LPDLQAKPVLSLRNVALVQPTDSNLEHAGAEREYLEKLGAEGGWNVTSIAARRKDVLEAMKSGTYDAWHFVGHGEVDPTKPNRSLIHLEEGEDLKPSMLAMGSVMNLGKAQPLVFLNACETGESISGLTGPAGWAERFLKAAWDAAHQSNGAAAFLGAYWPIRSDSAFAFAQAFYDEILGRNGGEAKTVGRAVLAARKTIKKEEDPTWLAYTVFAHPLARVEGEAS
jgi:CHAT domain-containing protein